MANPVGLVVEPVVLNRLGIFPESATAVLADWQRRLADLLQDQPLPESGEWASVASSFPVFVAEVLGWQEGDLLAASALEPPIVVPLDDYDETLAPTWVVNDPEGSPQLLVQVIPAGTDFDAIPKGGDGPPPVGGLAAAALGAATEGKRAAARGALERCGLAAGVGAAG